MMSNYIPLKLKIFNITLHDVAVLISVTPERKFCWVNDLIKLSKCRKTSTNYLGDKKVKYPMLLLKSKYLVKRIDF